MVRQVLQLGNPQLYEVSTPLKMGGHRHELEGALSELLQHECDHLDGILAGDRAMGKRSFALKGQGQLLK